MLKVHLRRTLVAAAILGLLAWLWAFRTPKVYQAEVQMKVGSPTLTADTSMPINIRKVLLTGILNDLDSDTGILKSQRIFKASVRFQHSSSCIQCTSWTFRLR